MVQYNQFRSDGWKPGSRQYRILSSDSGEDSDEVDDQEINKEQDTNQTDSQIAEGREQS